MNEEKERDTSKSKIKEQIVEAVRNGDQRKAFTLKENLKNMK